MTLHCPMCGEPCIQEAIKPTHVYNVICVECGACSVIFVGDQVITPGTQPDAYLGATEGL